VNELTQQNPTTEIKKHKMPVFTCSCGAKILVVPDLKEMARVIKNHQIEHARITGKCITEKLLTEQMLKVLSEQIFRA
jgi:hypothetical protein